MIAFGNGNYTMVHALSAAQIFGLSQFIQAGKGGFQVKAKGETTLVGGVIASTQAAFDQGKNSFQTGGKRTISDVQNTASYNAESNQASVGVGSMAGGSAGVGQDSGKAASTTQAGISGIAGNTNIRTGAAQTGIAKIFDADKVWADIQAQVAITAEFGKQASKTVGDYSSAQRKALQDQLRSASETDKAAVQAKISDLNMQERVLNVLVGAVSGLGEVSITKESLSAAAK